MIVNPGIRRFLGSAIQRLFNSASFYAPLTHTLALERGTGSPTFTRASTATFTDWEGVLRTVPSGCARFEGARMVRNLVNTTSEDFSNAAWTKFLATVTSGFGDPDGGTGAYRLQSTGASGYLEQVIATTKLPIANAAVMSCYVKSNTGASQTVKFARFAGIESKTVTTSWQRLEHFTASAGGSNFYLQDNGGNNLDILIYKCQIEDVTGQADQTASEYVSVGVLSAPYHGAGVDGVEFFNTDRGGAVIPAATNLGYLAEGARTQILATADIRDMTTAAWILGATMTRARTSIGADGAANSATRLTGGAVAATNTCYTTITAAASSRTYSALVKRITGTGPVRIVQTGTETDISSLINSTTYTLVELNASILNVAVGFKIDTNGDAIDVDFNQFEAGTFASSRIAAAGARASDVLTYPSAGNISGTVGAAYAEASTVWSSGTSVYNQLVGSYTTAVGALLSRGGVPTEIVIRDGTGVVAATGLPTMYGVPRKLSSNWSGSTSLITGSGATPTSGAFDGDMGFTSIPIGCSSLSDAQWYGTIRNVRIWQRALSASEMQAITA